MGSGNSTKLGALRREQYLTTTTTTPVSQPFMSQGASYPLMAYQPAGFSPYNRAPMMTPPMFQPSAPMLSQAPLLSQPSFMPQMQQPFLAQQQQGPVSFVPVNQIAPQLGQQMSSVSNQQPQFLEMSQPQFFNQQPQMMAQQPQMIPISQQQPQMMTISTQQPMASWSQGQSNDSQLSSSHPHHHIHTGPKNLKVYNFPPRPIQQ